MDKNNLTKEYSNGEVTIVWQNHLCKHAGVCVKMLPKVYQPQLKPWINTANATTEELIKQIQQCPSGALSFYMNKEKSSSE